MKQIIQLASRWEIRECESGPPVAADEIAVFESASGNDWLPATMPAQVHDILLAAGRIEDPANFEAAAKCLWVGERNWVYRTCFDAPRARRERLRFAGLDTLAEIYLNGEHIASHDDIYLPLEVGVTGKLRAKDNVLTVFFTSPWKWLEAHPLPHHLQGLVAHNRLLRKPHEDFNGFNGAHPHYTTIGIFGDVELIVSDAPDMGAVQVHTFLDADGDGHVRFQAPVQDCRPGENIEACVRLIGPGGKVVAEEARVPVRTDSRLGTASPSTSLPASTLRAMESEAVPSRRRGRVSTSNTPNMLGGKSDLLLNGELKVEQPDLWYPRGYGAQPLYVAEVELTCGGRVVDRVRRRVGFRHLEVSDSLDVKVNGLEVRIWGANWTPVDGHSKRYNRERTHATLDLAENANCVSLRIWGPGAPWHDNLYDECDRRGFLVWAEFFHTWGAYPDMPEYLAACRREAEHEVRRLCHHPSIYVWCGGNEVYMGWERAHGNTEVPGKELYEEIYPTVVHERDPEQRHYLVNSPYGGAFPNDARVGESHAYTHQNFVPGEHYPVFFAENTRVSTPLLKSMKRFLPPDRFWPEGFNGMVPVRRRKAAEALPQGIRETRQFDASELPPAWNTLTLGADFLFGRLGPVGDFYDSGDTPAGLIYRLGAAHARWIRDSVERYRRGYPWHDTSKVRRTRGHYLWKFNSTWPMIFSDVVDYLLEPNMAYYALRRAYAPVLVSLDITDHIRVWVINDSPRPVRGTLRTCLYDAQGVGLLYEQRHPVAVGPGRSELIGDMDGAGMFLRACNLFAELVDEAGKQIARTSDIAGIERNIVFPDAALTLEPNGAGDGVLVTTDVLARCVELQGRSPEGDEFGWWFEDNFFDLLPHEHKETRLLGRHRGGDITAGSMFLTGTGRLKL